MIFLTNLGAPFSLVYCFSQSTKEGHRMKFKLGIYKHYNGNHYQAIGIALHSETLEELVVYQSLYNNYGLWVRPKSMFLETVTVGKETKSRFEYIGPCLSVPPLLK
jgi:hypothetical protein